MLTDAPRFIWFFFKILTKDISYINSCLRIHTINDDFINFSISLDIRQNLKRINSSGVAITN